MGIVRFGRSDKSSCLSCEPIRFVPVLYHGDDSSLPLENAPKTQPQYVVTTK